MTKEKYCIGCNKNHPVEEFNRRIDGSDGLNTYCRKYVNDKVARREAKRKADREYAKMFSPI